MVLGSRYLFSYCTDERIWSRMAKSFAQAQTVTVGDRIHLLTQVRLTPEPGYREGGRRGHTMAIGGSCPPPGPTVTLELDLKHALPPGEDRRAICLRYKPSKAI